MYWKHPTQRTGTMDFGRRRRSPIRRDGVFEAPDDDGLQARLVASGCIPLGEAPDLPEPEPREPSKTAKQRRIEARLKRRAEEKPVAQAPVAHPITHSTPSNEGPDDAKPTSEEVDRLTALAREHGVDTHATTEQGLKAALTKAGVDWKQEE